MRDFPAAMAVARNVLSRWILDFRSNYMSEHHSVFGPERNPISSISILSFPGDVMGIGTLK